MITTFLLVEDLHRPMKFLTLLTRPNTKSWLVKGAWILMAFSGTDSATLAARWFGFDGIVDALRWVNAVLALGVAGYTAYLFAQCEGRDLWQSKLLLPHLLVQALLCGAAVFLFFNPKRNEAGEWLRALLILALVAHAVFCLLERKKKHATTNATQAAAFLGVVRWGRVHALRFGMVVGVLIAALMSQTPLAFIAVVPALLGLFVYKYAYVRAAQLPPLS
jgi:formate-dependent nitrite reductase membrane component NrfD